MYVCIMAHKGFLGFDQRNALQRMHKYTRARYVFRTLWNTDYFTLLAFTPCVHLPRPSAANNADFFAVFAAKCDVALFLCEFSY